MKYIRIAFSFLIGMTIFVLLAAFVEDGNFSFDFLSRLTSKDRFGMVICGSFISMGLTAAIESVVEDSNKKSK